MFLEDQCRFRSSCAREKAEKRFFLYIRYRASGHHQRFRLLQRLGISVLIERNFQGLILLADLATELLDGVFGFLRETRFTTVNMIEAARDFAADFEVRYLIFAHRHFVSAVNHDISRLHKRIAEKAVRCEIFLFQVFLLLFVRRHALQPAERRDHAEQQRQLSMLRHLTLQKNRRLIRVEPRREPIGHHVKGGAFNYAWIVVMARKRMPVGHEIKALELRLQFHPVFERTVIVADVHETRRAHAGENAIFEHKFTDPPKRPAHGR